MRDRPDIRAAEAQLHAATAAVGVAFANLYPRLDLSGNASLQALSVGQLFEPGSAAGGLAANLSAPLFNHNAIHARQRAAAAAAGAALHTYEQTVLQSFAQVADLLSALAEDGPLLATEQRTVASSSRTIALTRQGYAAGCTNILQVLDAERVQQKAILGLIQAQIGHHENAMRLLLAIGGQPPAEQPQRR